jgi:hypothetical protein
MRHRLRREHIDATVHPRAARGTVGADGLSIAVLRARFIPARRGEQSRSTHSPQVAKNRRFIPARRGEQAAQLRALGLRATGIRFIPARRGEQIGIVTALP